MLLNHQTAHLLSPAPFENKDLCIQNATIAAGFGGFMVTAEICNSTPQPLLDWLAKNRPSLQQATPRTPPGVIASFGKGKDALSVFYGRASNQWKQDPTEQQLSFSCAVAGSGPQ
jgi:hypothetical protein